MAQSKSCRIVDCFSEVTDPRTRKVTYPLVNIITMAITAVVAGADNFVAIARFAESKKEWLGRFLDLSEGIPSHDRFNAILAAIKPEEFERCLTRWILSLSEVSEGQIVAIDAKALRGSWQRGDRQHAIRMISAWAEANRIVLGQRVIDGDSNETKAIPQLLKMLELNGALVTIDAAGCYPEVAQSIVDAGADYCLAAKRNQGRLYSALEAFFDAALSEEFVGRRPSQHVTEESRGGDYEVRCYFIARVPEGFSQRSRWPKLRALGLSVTMVIRNGQQVSTTTRYYILSKYMPAKRFAAAVRGHWGIENHLHWQLDVSFGEDASRVRRGHAAANFSLLRRIALQLLKRNTSVKIGVANRRLKAAWDEDYLTQTVFG